MNKQLAKERNRRWYIKNKNRLAIIEAARYILKKKHIRAVQINTAYGLTVAEYEHIWKSQCGLCAICQHPETAKGKTLAVDHCHETGKVRGLLCRGCNVGIGNLKEDILLLQEAVKYLTKEIGSTVIKDSNQL